MDTKNVAGCVVGNIMSCTAAASAVSLDELTQMVTFITAIIGLAVTFITGVVVPVVKKVKKALEDKKLTIDEIEDIANTTKDKLDEYEDEVKRTNGDK